MNVLLVLNNYNLSCSILKNTNFKLYLYNCKYSKFETVNNLEDSLFDYIDIIISNDNMKRYEIEKLVNSFNGDKNIYLFSNLKFTITNIKCIFNNYIKLEKIIYFLNEMRTNKINSINLTLSQEKQDTNNETNILSNKKKEFHNLCVKYIYYVRQLELATISQNNLYEAVLVEYRCLPHLEFLIRNCIHKLGSEWSQTIICGNLNFHYILNIVKCINRNIKVIKTQYDNLTPLEYSDMLMTRDFWDLIVGEKILIYQEDTCIFKNNINDFLEWDFIGAPFDEMNNHQNGGLSLRSKSVMIDIIENAYPLNIINCNHGKIWMNIKKHDKLPEDIFFTQHMRINKNWKLAPLTVAYLFSCENKFNCDSFGMHCFWLGNGIDKWKRHFEKFLQNYINKKNNYTISKNLKKLNIEKTEDDNSYKFGNQIENNVQDIINESTINKKLLSDFILNNKILIKIEKIELPTKPFLYYKENNDYKPIIGIDDLSIKKNCIIPKKIYKVFVNDTIENLPKNIFINAINKWEEMYPDYELIIYDSKKIYDFLMKYYGKEFIYIYDTIIPHAFKCDFFRYCLLYKEGGIYSDLKQVPIKRIDLDNYEFIASYEKHIGWEQMLGLDFLPCQNCFIACIKEHPYIKSAIDMCIQNVLKNRYNSFCTDVTGPVMLGRCIKYVRQNITINYNKEKFLYFYEYKKNNTVEFFINQYDDLNAEHVIKHKFDDSKGADWTILNENNDYSYLWNKRNIYKNVINKNYKTNINNYYRFDNSYSKLYEFTNFKPLINILSKLNLIILYKTSLDLEHLNYNFTIVKIIDNHLFVNNQFYSLINVSEEEMIDEIIIISKKYILISDDKKIQAKYKNVTNVESYEKNIKNYFNKSHINIKDNFIYGIKPYFIYFPQFHTIPENNINFYYGYTDTNNLFEINQRREINKKKLCETPCFKELEITEYNLLNTNLLQKQIDILKYLNLPGFAMYYYWFDVNTITNKNMIFKDVIDSFFNKIDMKSRKIFFIWANENWSDTIALSNPDNNHIIKNTYSDDSLMKNAKNLINYFKNDCYLKIDNKPVYYIYHSWKTTIERINKFYNILNDLCIESGFKGVHFSLNTMFSDNDVEYEAYDKFYLNLNYKNDNLSNKYYSKDLESFVVDYYKYINSGLNIKSNQVNTLFYNFDNRPRFYKPDKLKHATFCINNCELNKYLFTKQIVETYKNTTNENQKILLINAWNEWGENMTFEPSNEFGYFNLNLLFSCL